MITLGFNYSQMHDSAACIVRDGELLFAIAEERLSRVKHDSSFPHRSIRACLDFAKCRPDQLDEICQGWPHPWRLFAADLKCYATGQTPVSYFNVLNSTRYFVSMAHQRGGFRRFTYHFGPTRARMRFVNHHFAHALSAYAYSGFEDAAVLIVDGRGAWEASSIWRGHKGRLEHILTIPWPNSLGLFYARFTGHLGFEPYADEWKVMGLAPYGRPGVDLSAFLSLGQEMYRVNSADLLNDDVTTLTRRLGPARQPETEIEERYKDVAFAVQDSCEKAMLALVRLAVGKAGSRNVCMAGGVALNSKANGKILISGLVDDLFVQPAASDEGVALGAALAPYLDGGEPVKISRMRHLYLGPESSDDEIEKALCTYKLRATRLDDPASATAELLSQGKIIGWFQGRMEFGPRALGARSILADPRDLEMNAKVNNAVKFRESWRPFAPALPVEAAPEYLESAHDSPFMISTSAVRPEKRSIIPSVTHVDGTARPQTVEFDVSPLYYRMIEEFGRRTGVPVVMNTSFNLRGEPIVCTPTDAIRTFFTSGMDALVIGHFLVEK